MKFLFSAPAAALLCACSVQPAPNDSFAENVSEVREVPADHTQVDAPRNASAVSDTSRYLGRWIGVEGMYLTISPGATRDRLAMEMQYDLDNKAVVEGRLEGDAILFQRGGRTLTLRPTDGAATGLKYLADKTECLTVAPGEGYCRA